MLKSFCASLGRQIKSLETFTQERSFFIRIPLILVNLCLYVMLAAVHVLLLLVAAPNESFQIIDTLDPVRGYTTSYIGHLQLKRQLQLGAIITMVAAISANVIVGVLYSGVRPVYAATCNISGPTTIDQSYVDTNSCADIHITGTATLVVSSINLNGSSAGVFYVDSGVTATFDGALTLSDTVDSLVVNGTLRPVAGNTTGLSVTAQTVTINSSGTINANSRGCAGGTLSGDGLGPDATTGTCTASTTGYGDGSSSGGAGGSHGGAGGRAADSFTGTTYDSNTAPTLFGSGGGAGGGNIGGAGGGRVRLDVAGTLTLDGTITANGAAGLAGSGNASGGGSGGSVYITCGTLAGSSTIATTGGNGGDGSSNDGGGGGGGRVSIYYTTLGNFTLSNATATKGLKGGAGQNNAADGADGTVNTVQYTVPVTPSITAPTASATNQSRNIALTSATYSSNGLAHTTSDWQISDDNTFSDSDCSDSNIVWCASASSNKTSVTVNSSNGTFQNALASRVLLAPNMTYYVRVRHTNTAGNSAWSTAVAFTTVANTVPVTPTNSAPANGATSQSKNPTLTASAFSDSDGDAHASSSWRIRESTDCSGSNVWSKSDDTTSLTSIVVNTTNGTFADSLSGQTSLKAHTTYSFQVQYKDTYSGTSSLSSCTTFTTTNTAPALDSSVPNQTLTEDTNVTGAFDLDTYFSDVDFNDDDQYTCTASNGFSSSLGMMTINSNRTVDFTLASNVNGTDTITFACQDGGGLSTSSNTITVNVVAANDAPTVLPDSLPTVSFVAGTTTVPVIDLNDYFTDIDGDSLTYSAAGQSGVIVSIADGAVTLSADSAFSGTETITFTATDPSGATATTTAMIVIVTAADTTEPISEISHTTGTSKGEGVIEIIDEQNNVVARFTAFTEGGVIPRIANVNGTDYIFAVKHRSGSVMAIYDTAGQQIRRARLSPKLHWRKLVIGQLDSNHNSEEVTTVTRRGRMLYIKTYSFYPSTNVFELREQTVFSSRIHNDHYDVTVANKSVHIINQKGRTVLDWKPF